MTAGAPRGGFSAVPRGATGSAPGKLYIAGEYAVVEPGHRAVLVALDRFITVRAATAEGSGRISSDLYKTGPVKAIYLIA